MSWIAETAVPLHFRHSLEILPQYFHGTMHRMGGAHFAPRFPKFPIPIPKDPKRSRFFGMTSDHPRKSGMFWDVLGHPKKKFIPKHPKFFSSFGIFCDFLGLTWDRPRKIGIIPKNWDHPKKIPEILGTFGIVGGPCDHCIFAL